MGKNDDFINLFWNCLTFRYALFCLLFKGNEYETLHRILTPSEEIAFTAQPKINSNSQVLRYGRSIFCLPHWPKISVFWFGVRSQWNFKSTRDYAKFFDPSGLLMYYKDSKKLRPLFYPRNKIHGPIYFKAKNTYANVFENPEYST